MFIRSNLWRLFLLAYDAVLDRYELRERLELLLRDVDVNNLDDLASEC